MRCLPSADHAQIPNRFIHTLESNANPDEVAAEYDVKPDYVYRTLLTGICR
jgi:hypothetical protein